MGRFHVFSVCGIITIMRIAIFTDLYAPWGDGGIVSSVKAQKDELERLGHEVVVFCPGFQSREKNVVTVPSHPKLRINGAVVAKRPEIVEEFVMRKFPQFDKFDVVHVHYEASCSLAGMKLAAMFSVPVVQTMHGREDMAIAVNVPWVLRGVVAGAMNRMHKKYIPHDTTVNKDKFQATTGTRARMWELMVNHANAAKVVITPSDHFAQKLEHYGVVRPIRVVSNGVPDEIVAAKVEPRVMEDGDVLKMIWNSRVSKEKRMLPFLQAVAMLKRPYILYVYGGGNQLKKAKKFAAKNNLKVKFYGKCKRQKSLVRMKEVHLAVMASYNFDTQGMTLLEAEAMGVPVFFCDPSMREVVPEGGYVLSGGNDATSMAMALERLPAEQIARMSKQMLRHRKEVAQETQIKKLLAVYKEAIRKDKNKKAIPN